MIHLGNSPVRPYRSPLREAQAQETRNRILEGALRVLAGGVADLSIPAIAREAGVSVPTVYRNFRTKRDLLEAIYPYAVRRANVEEPKPPKSLADFREGVRILFDRLEAFDDMARAGIASRGAEEIRHLSIGRRLATARQATEAIAPELSGEDRERLIRLVIVLTTSAAGRMWCDHLGLSAAEAADDVEWVLRAVITGSRPEADR
jgi:AcrR family transcriptional regulator